MGEGIHLHFHVNAQGPLADDTIRAVLSFMGSLNLATVAHSGIAGKIDPAPCSITRAVMLDRTGASPGVVSRILRHADTLAEARYIDHDLSAEVAAISALPALDQKNEHFPLEHRSASADTSRAEEVRPMVAFQNHKSTSTPAQAHSRPQQSTRDRAGFDLDFSSVPPSPDTAAQNRAVEHGNGQSRACAQSSLIAALEAQARAVLAMCEALRKE